MSSKTISCVIAAYNEEKGIATVLKAVNGHPLLNEVIVVDDGSHDRTSDIVKQFPNIRLIQHPVNKGKTISVADGIAAATGEFICALDADLIGITADSVTRLITPVIEGRATVSISLREEYPWFWHPFHLDYISGERVYPKTLMADHLGELQQLSKFGLEVFMNRLIIKQKLPVAIVYLPNVISPLKYSKQGFFRGLVGDILMIRDIFKTVPIWECLSQIAHLMKLRVVLPADDAQSISSK
jgi:glycosyltransferase involved in cell wall biosynthesis